MDFRFHTKHATSTVITPSALHLDLFGVELQNVSSLPYENLREVKSPFFWEEGNSWIVCRYSDVLSIIESEISASTLSSLPYLEGFEVATGSRAAPNMVLMRPPRLSLERIDKFIAPFFQREKIDLLRSSIRNIAIQQISQLGGQFDLVMEYSDRIAIRVLALVLGIPAKYLLLFSQLCHNYLYIYYRGKNCTTDEIVDRCMHVDIGMALIQQIIKERRSVNRREYLIDLILDCKNRGETLSNEEVLEFSLRLIINCYESISLLISGSIYHIASRRKIKNTLKKYPELWPKAVLETLRYAYFVKPDILRRATRELSIGGQTIAQGDQLYLLIGTALRDPEVICAPETYDIGRQQPDLLKIGYRQYDYFGLNLTTTTAEVAAASFFDSFATVSTKPPKPDPTHRALRAISSLTIDAS